jgi:hypothetical protein
MTMTLNATVDVNTDGEIVREGVLVGGLVSVVVDGDWVKSHPALHIDVLVNRKRVAFTYTWPDGVDAVQQLRQLVEREWRDYVKMRTIQLTRRRKGKMKR